MSMPPPVSQCESESSCTPQERPRLDVPSCRAIGRRKEALLERMMKDKKRPVTTKLETASNVLDRVRAFLPQMKQANQHLVTLKKEDIEIENVPDDSDSYVEMNLCLVSDDSNGEDLEDDSLTEDEESEPSTTFQPNISNHQKPLVVEMLDKVTSSSTDVPH